jgi:PII-like signaling protein
MLKAGSALKVSIYLSDGSRHHGAATECSIVDFLFTHGVSGATVFKGVAGFGVDHHLHSASFVELSDRLPVKVEFTESKEKVEELLARLTELTGTGQIEIQETMVVKPAGVLQPAPVGKAS